jgi:hypothetical protein
MKKAFGLDLAGYSTAGSALAMAARDRPLTVTIWTDHAFADEAHGEDQLAEVCNPELDCLREILGDGQLFVDVPIDLQDLPLPPNPRFVWQLTKRPVDQALGGLSPLADKTGACVARMQNLWRMLRDQDANPLGNRLFETYPAGSLKHAGHPHREYKGEVEYSNGCWKPRPSENERPQQRNNILARMLNNFSWTPENDGFILTHDEFDAGLCALAGVCDRLEGAALQQRINEELAAFGGGYSAPAGYVLLNEIPLKVGVRRRPWREFGQ